MLARLPLSLTDDESHVCFRLRMCGKCVILYIRQMYHIVKYFLTKMSLFLGRQSRAATYNLTWAVLDSAVLIRMREDSKTKSANAKSAKALC